jgi:predicted ArsR family transcriptional regulator
MAASETPEQVAAIALLSEPARRVLYGYVAAQGREVGRDEAANAVGVSRALAAFHLDKLAEAGLLDVAYRRLSGRRGPGAGRPAKLYRRSGATLEVSFPARRYRTLARMLALTLERVGAKGSRALQDAARDLGEGIGAEARGPDTTPPPVEKIEAVLADSGFEPAREEDGRIVLRNCPFDGVAREFTDLVCGANVAFMEGVLLGSGTRGLGVSLQPEEGRCCAVFRAASAGEGRARGSG